MEQNLHLSKTYTRAGCEVVSTPGSGLPNPDTGPEFTTSGPFHFMTYSEKLKDPRWQKKRLEILNRDKFTCLLCGDTTTTLHVHHKAYNGLEPWEAGHQELETLCDHCHTAVHYGQQKDFNIIRVYKAITDNGNAFLSCWAQYNYLWLVIVGEGRIITDLYVAPRFMDIISKTVETIKEKEQQNGDQPGFSALL